MERFWGPVDSNVNWCEADYAVTPYVAEFWNTLSSLWLCYFGVVGLVKLKTSFGSEWRWKLSFWSMVLTGLGSMAFHASLRHAAQALDEMPMMLCNMVFLYILAHVRTASVPARRRDYLAWVLAAVGVAMIAVYLFLPDYYWVFLSCYSGCVTFELFYSWYLVLTDPTWRTEAQRLSPMLPWSLRPVHLLAIGSLAYVLGFVLWVTENTLCGAGPAAALQAPPERVQLFQRFQLHAWWHFGASLGTYLWITWCIQLRTVTLKRQFRPDYAHGAVPHFVVSVSKP